MTPTARPRARRLFPLALALLAAPIPASLPAPARAAPAASPGTTSQLSAGQRARAQARQLKFNTDLAALRADKTLTGAQKQARFKTMSQTMDRDMLAILTPDQRAIVLRQRAIGAGFLREARAIKASKTLSDAQKKDRLAALAAQADKDTLATLPPGSRAQVLDRRQAQEALDRSITPAQKKQFAATMLSTRSQMQAVSADKALSDTAKGQRIADLARQAQAKNMALLTPAQRALYARTQAAHQ